MNVSISVPGFDSVDVVVQLTVDHLFGVFVVCFGFSTQFQAGLKTLAVEAPELIHVPDGWLVPGSAKEGLPEGMLDVTSAFRLSLVRIFLLCRKTMTCFRMCGLVFRFIFYVFTPLLFTIPCCVRGLTSSVVSY